MYEEDPDLEEEEDNFAVSDGEYDEDSDDADGVEAAMDVFSKLTMKDKEDTVVDMVDDEDESDEEE